MRHIITGQPCQWRSIDITEWHDRLGVRRVSRCGTCPRREEAGCRWTKSTFNDFRIGNQLQLHVCTNCMFCPRYSAICWRGEASDAPTFCAARHFLNGAPQSRQFFSTCHIQIIVCSVRVLKNFGLTFFKILRFEWRHAFTLSSRTLMYVT